MPRDGLAGLVPQQLGIGNMMQPILPNILSGLVEGAKKLGTKEGYSGYSMEQGMTAQCKKIAKNVQWFGQCQPGVCQ